jgi:hypothetical protein
LRARYAPRTNQHLEPDTISSPWSSLPRTISFTSHPLIVQSPFTAPTIQAQSRSQPHQKLKMPGKTPQQDGKGIPTGKGEDGSLDPDVLALHAILRTFALGDNFHALDGKVRENDRLRQRLDDLQITYSTNLRTLSGMNEELVEKDAQHAKALGAQQEKLDSATEAKKRAVADLAVVKKSLADKSSEVKDLEVRFQKLIRENKDKDTRIHALEEAELLRKQTAEEAKRREEQLRGQLATATDKLREQGERLKQASDSWDLVRSFIMPLTTIRDKGDNM